MRKYAALHNHDVNSEKDGMVEAKDYVYKIHDFNKEHGAEYITALAITNHGNMFSLVKAFQACTTPIQLEENDIERTTQPIIGNEIYYCEDIKTSSDDDRFHMVLLAKNEIGLKNLYLITTHAGMHKIKPKQKEFQRTDEQFLKDHGEGIIALSACFGGILGQLILNGKYDEAKEKALFYNEIFDDFYLEVQPHEIPEQLIVNAELVRMSEETGLKLVITSDSHYVNREDKEYHNLLKEIAFQIPYSVDAHFKTPDELEEFCIKHNIPLECIDNTVEIAEQCKVDIRPKDKRGFMPDFPCPDGYNEDSYLAKLALDGLKEKLVKNKIKEPLKYIKRFNYEYRVISNAGFSGYFLILWDWIKYCESEGILMGPGRGSAAGCLICYCLGITKVDPVKYDLYFERFLSEERLDFPDIDTDISKEDRPKGIEYFLNKYGADFVCQIVTVTKFKVKNTIQAVMSAPRGYDKAEANALTAKIPSTVGEQVPLTYDLLEDIYNEPEKHDDLTDREIDTCRNAYEELQKTFNKYPEVYSALTHLKGCVASFGCHAGGVVISSKVLKENLPLMKNLKGAAVLPIIQLEMGDLDFFKLLKIDALGLKTLSQISVTMQIAGLTMDWFHSEDFDDPEVYKMLQRGETIDVFQMVKRTPTRMLKVFDVTDIEGISIVNACNRPGPLGSGMDKIYADNVANGTWEKFGDGIDEVLEATKGCLFYQEQCQMLGRTMAGYSLGMADKKIRKTIGKFLTPYNGNIIGEQSKIGGN